MGEKVHFVKFNLVEPRMGEMIGFCKRNPRLVTQLVGKLGTLYLKNFVPDSLTRGHSEYVRFMIIGMARTGSNFLRGSLMSHRRVVVLGDIVRDKDTISWGIPFYPQSKSALSLYQEDPVKFLESEVFVKFPKRVAAVGFKTLYPNMNKEIWEPIQTYLGGQKALKVIHIKRRNILKTHLSLKRVRQKKGKWKNISGTEEKEGAVHLDYKECLRAFENVRKWEQECDAFFKGHHKIEVVYEELCGDYDGEMRRIQEFLNVEYQVVRPLTYKQHSQPLSQAISNYVELKDRFKHTPWEGFFKD